MADELKKVIPIADIAKIIEDYKKGCSIDDILSQDPESKDSILIDLNQLTLRETIPFFYTLCHRIINNFNIAKISYYDYETKNREVLDVEEYREEPNEEPSNNRESKELDDVKFIFDSEGLDQDPPQDYVSIEISNFVNKILSVPQRINNMIPEDELSKVWFIPPTDPFYISNKRGFNREWRGSDNLRTEDFDLKLPFSRDRVRLDTQFTLYDLMKNIFFAKSHKFDTHYELFTNVETKQTAGTFELILDFDHVL